MNSEYIETSRAIYKNAESEYQRYYFDERAGGFVLIHQQHNLNNSEIFIAEVLAKIGMRVRMLSEQAPSGTKTPDADVDGQMCEFKELTKESNNLKNRVQEGFGKAKNQSANAVIFHVNIENYDILEIDQGIRQAIYWDVQQLIQTVILVFNNQSVQKITREEWENGERFSRI
ncbi:CdiA C-terminal domain-containing protein [Microcoleus sp. Pol12A5]|uniref:CdiA C-terminal domain-containing protein n=1 Tax=Microcoleus sp. Pol12A5 TaxID=3055392 RepID=UPI002FD122E0